MTPVRPRLERHCWRRHGYDLWRADNYSRTADVLLLPDPRRAGHGEAVVTVQRDWGNRANRKHARLKHTIEDRGLDAFRAEVERRAGVQSAGAAYAYSMGDRYG
jgi:sulfite reductase (NADPH) hemoprotein beta-component